jgi:hypothetical protein
MPCFCLAERLLHFCLQILQNITAKIEKFARVSNAYNIYLHQTSLQLKDKNVQWRPMSSLWNRPAPSATTRWIQPAVIPKLL